MNKLTAFQALTVISVFIAGICLTLAAKYGSFTTWAVAMFFMLSAVIFHLFARITELEEALDRSRRLEKEAMLSDDMVLYNDLWEHAN